MNVIIHILSVIGAITVLAFLAGVAVLIYMAWSVYKCKRDEERAWQQERELMERGSAEGATAAELEAKLKTGKGK